MNAGVGLKDVVDVGVTEANIAWTFDQIDDYVEYLTHQVVGPVWDKKYIQKHFYHVFRMRTYLLDAWRSTAQIVHYPAYMFEEYLRTAHLDHER